MAFKDLRGFILTLESLGELSRIKEEVDWRYEIAGWTRYSYDMKPSGPALLLENIKDYEPGYRILTGGLGSYRRVAIALNLNPDTSIRKIVDVYKDRVAKPIPPVMVSDGPVKENIHLGKDVNVLEFPVPWWTPRDGGRYIGTWHCNVTKNPTTGIRNLGVYRMQVYDNKRVGIGFSPNSDMGIHYSQKERLNESLEMAVVIGADETLVLAASTGVPENVDEYGIAGALKEEPVELVKCETIDLEVPANAEIVIEGKVLPHKRKLEGPFGEYTGYHNKNATMYPVFEVTGVTHRDNAIFRGMLSGKPIVEDHIIFSILAGANLLNLRGGRVKSIIQHLIFKYRLFPYFYWLYPYTKVWLGYWPPLCVPPKEILELVELKWRKTIDGQVVDEQRIVKLTKDINDKLRKDWEDLGKKFGASRRR